MGHTCAAARICLTEVKHKRSFFRRNFQLLLAAALLTGLIAAAYARQAAALPAGSWGLGFQTEGEPPTGNTANARLLEYDAAYLGDTSQKKRFI